MHGVKCVHTTRTSRASYHRCVCVSVCVYVCVCKCVYQSACKVVQVCTWHMVCVVQRTVCAWREVCAYHAHKQGQLSQVFVCVYVRVHVR